MSNEAQPLVITEQVNDLLRQVHKHISPMRERTLFSVGGRGYFENPASDMLRFFLTPDGEHGFKTLFLRAFFECIGVDCSKLKLQGVTAVREDRNIDLVIDGPDWFLVIENKIRASQNNPWKSYEDTARRKGKECYFAILSPNGKSAAPEKWKAVSYKQYCENLRKAFADAVFDIPYSKWLVFAREFIIHLETELYNPAMPLEHKQIEFVEQYLTEIEQVKKLSKEYTELLLRDMQKRLSEVNPGHHFSAWDAGYCLTCKDLSYPVWEFQLWTPAHTGRSGKFDFIIWHKNLTQEQCLLAQNVLSGLNHLTEGKTWDGWSTAARFDDRNEALDECCRIASLLYNLWKDEIPPLSPPDETGEPLSGEIAPTDHGASRPGGS